MALTEVDGTTTVLVEKDGTGGHKMAVIAEIDADGGVYFRDENGTPYGIKHIDNKPRVSAMSYQYDIAEGNVPNHYAVNKFGHNSTVAATPSEPVWDYSGAYTYLADDTFATMYISSDSSADQSMAYTVSGIDSDYNYSTVTVTLNAADGQTFVPLTSGATDNKWWRIFRALNASGTAAVGNIYISKDNTDTGPDGIPDTVADIQAQIRIGFEQTLMALFTIPAGRDGTAITNAYLTSYYASTSTNKVTEVDLYVRPFGGVFNIKHLILVNLGAYHHDFDFPIGIAPKSDIAILASAVGGGGEVSAGFDLWYE